MSVLHHVIKSLGNRYDPMGGGVIAHVVGGGHAGNTQFRDLSPLQTPCVTHGGSVGADVVGPFGSAVAINKAATGVSCVTLTRSDSKFKFNGGLLAPVVTIDGWFYCAQTTTATNKRVFSIHAGHGAGSWYDPDNFPSMSLLLTGTATNPTLGLYRTTYVPDGFGGGTYQEQSVASFTLTGARNNKWIYYHLVLTYTSTTVVMTADDLPTITRTGVGGYWDAFSSGISISLGGVNHASQHQSLDSFYTFRMTKGHRPYNLALRTSPWPEAGGAQNWMGDPAGVAGQPGQRVLNPSEVWVVPQGVTEISAVAVGCKLSIAGTDVLAATWPVLGDGGGQGGAGGTGHSDTVVSWSNGPPAPGGAFGGTPGTVRSETTYYYYGGGGGAGGYTGNGGHGVNTQGSTAAAGQGGGGGGGATQAWGGGVGLKGQGASGTGGSNPGQPGSADGTTYGGGKPGSSGAILNGTPGNNLAWRNNIPVTQGQVVLCTYIGQSGQTGAARIMWGDDRSFPSNAGDVE